MVYVARFGSRAIKSKVSFMASGLVQALSKFDSGGQGGIRTPEGIKPADLQSAPFGHFGTYPRQVEHFRLRDPPGAGRSSFRLAPPFPP